MLNTRTILWLALGAMLFLNYEAWMKDYPTAAANASLSGSGAPNTLGNTVPQAVDGVAPASAAPPARLRRPSAGRHHARRRSRYGNRHGTGNRRPRAGNAPACRDRRARHDDQSQRR